MKCGAVIIDKQFAFTVKNAMTTEKEQHILIKTYATYIVKGKFQLFKCNLQHH